MAGAWTRMRTVARARLTAWLESVNSTDTWVCLIFVALAIWVSQGLWADPANRAFAHNPNDQALNEWFLAHGVLFWTGDFSLHTTRLNAPDGINLMSNASHILHGIVLAPVTVLFGAAVSFAVLVAVNLAATAAGWYLLFARGLGRNRVAAMVGGLLAGFAPGMISQTYHSHIATQWLVPAMVWCVILMTRARSSRDTFVAGGSLAALVCAQAFLAEEILYLTALTLLIFTVAYAGARARWALRVAPKVVTGLVFAVWVSSIALLYPLWMQFFGPQHTPNAPFGAVFFPADLRSYFVYSPLSVGGSPENVMLGQGPTELNTFLGWPLAVLVVCLAIWRRRSPSVVAAAMTIVLMAYLSLGVTVIFDREPTDLPSLYRVIADLPVIDAALPTRYALALPPLIAVILVDALGTACALTGGLVRSGRTLRVRMTPPTGGTAGVLVPLATAVALTPLFPIVLPTIERAPVPQFITTGAWRQCVPDGGVLIPVPLPTPGEPDRMRWAAAANAGFAIPEGLFLANYAADRRTSVGTYKQPTSALLAEVAKNGVVPPVTDQMRAQAQRDLAFWRADCVALARVRYEAQLRSTLEQLLGPPTLISDTWTWPVTR